MDAILKNRYNDIYFIGVVFSDEIWLADAKSYREKTANINARKLRTTSANSQVGIGT